MSRRSTRLSSTLSSSSSAAASASGSGSAGASAARSSPSLPAASATRRRTGAGKERRFEDILADGGADETMDVGAESAFVHQVQVQPKKQVKRKAEEAPKEKGRVRGPRKTYGEEKGEDDFIFSRAAPSSTAAPAAPSTSGARGASKTSRRGIPGALGAPPSSDGAAQPSSEASRFSSRTRMEPLPLEEETPIIRRNQALRAGLSTASGSSSSSGAAAREEEAPVRRRRDSMGLKTSRRVSALSNGALAHPHESVPFSELFRHASTSLTDAQRMRTLLAWILRRGVERAKRGEWEVGKGKRRVGMKEGDRERVKGMEGTLEEVMRKTLEELERGKIDVDWSSRTRAASGSSAVHPRNVTNAATATRLEGVVGSMAREVSRWEAEEREIEAFEAETARLVAALDSADPVAAAKAEAALATAEEWEESDLDDDAKRAWELATHTLAGEATWLEERRRGSSKSAAPAASVSDEVKAVEAEIRRLASQAGPSNEEETQGTARDRRFGELEFNVDRLHSLSHSYAQLSSLAARYVSAISLRAASALQAQRAPASSAASGSSSSAPAGAEEAHVESAGGAAARSREDVERLLARLAREVEEGQEKEEENVAEESAADLLAALVGKRR